MATDPLTDLRRLGMMTEEVEAYELCEWRGGCDCADNLINSLAAALLEKMPVAVKGAGAWG